MTAVLIIKAFILGLAWTIGWVARFAYTNADFSAKNLGIVFAPWIIPWCTLFYSGGVNHD